MIFSEYLKKFSYNTKFKQDRYLDSRIIKNEFETDTIWIIVH